MRIKLTIWVSIVELNFFPMHINTKMKSYVRNRTIPIMNPPSRCHTGGAYVRRQASLSLWWFFSLLLTRGLRIDVRLFSLCYEIILFLSWVLPSFLPSFLLSFFRSFLLSFLPSFLTGVGAYVRRQASLSLWWFFSLILTRGLRIDVRLFFLCYEIILFLSWVLPSFLSSFLPSLRGVGAYVRREASLSLWCLFSFLVTRGLRIDVRLVTFMSVSLPRYERGIG